MSAIITPDILRVRMPVHSPIQLTKCLWVQGVRPNAGNVLIAGYQKSLLEMGVRVEPFCGSDNRAEVKRLRQIISQTDDHVVLFYLNPDDLRSIRDILISRGNYSLIADDWWLTPHWVLRNADYVLFRSFNAFAVRLGLAPFARFREAPLLEWPRPFNRFMLAMAGVRLGSLALCPVLESVKWVQRQLEALPVERMVYFPYPIREEEVPLRDAKVDYDFSNLGKSNTSWLTRDPFVPSWFSGANFYADRQRILQAMLKGAQSRFRIYDWQIEGRWLGFEEYCKVARQSHFTLVTGGIHQTLVPKYVEFACLGTPMVGRLLPYEYPWLEQCLFPIDPLTVNSGNIVPQLEAALAQQGRFKENCLRMRDTLLKLYSFEGCLRVAQSQLDTNVIPPGYLKVNFRSAAPGPLISSGRLAAQANPLNSYSKSQL